VNKMKGVIRAILVFGWIVSPVAMANDHSGIQIRSASTSFSPVLGQKATIEVETGAHGLISLDVLEPDGNVIRSIVAESAVEPGKHELSWDGNDLTGQVVPDEAYSIRVSLLDEQGKKISQHVPSQESGGELLNNLVPELSHTHITFNLPESARVLVRIGLKDGPMLNNVLRWKPRVAGRNRVAWDGFDLSGVVDLRKDARATALVIAHQLPKFSIITHGNYELNYTEWFEEIGLLPKSIALVDQKLARGVTRIAREYYRSRFEDREAKIALSFVKDGKTLTAPYTLVDRTALRVNADIESQWLLDESLYEIGFFIDGVFMSEEEQGYLPMSWRLNTEQLSDGEHILTVNVSGFDGRVGVASTRFTVNH